MIVLVPSVLEGTREFPLTTLGNGRIQSEVVGFLSLLRHQFLENGVVVDILDGNPSAVGPRVVTRIHQLQRVDVIRGCSQAHLEGTLLVIDQGRRSEEHRRSRRNAEGLFRRPAGGLLDDLSVVRSGSAINCQSNTHYTLEYPNNQYKERQVSELYAFGEILK